MAFRGCGPRFVTQRVVNPVLESNLAPNRCASVLGFCKLELWSLAVGLPVPRALLTFSHCTPWDWSIILRAAEFSACYSGIYFGHRTEMKFENTGAFDVRCLRKTSTVHVDSRGDERPPRPALITNCRKLIACYNRQVSNQPMRGPRVGWLS